MVRFVALAIMLAIGAGVYGFVQQSNVAAAQLRIDATEKELQTWKTRLTQYQAEGKTVAANLETCNAKVVEIQTALDAATAAMDKRPGAKR